jgi:hypothetical protein
MMEKYDGVRVIWNGKALYSRYTNKLIEVPQTSQFPSIPFEGELWYE